MEGFWWYAWGTMSNVDPKYLHIVTSALASRDVGRMTKDRVMDALNHLPGDHALRQAYMDTLQSMADEAVAYSKRLVGILNTAKHAGRAKLKAAKDEAERAAKEREERAARLEAEKEAARLAADASKV